MKSPFTLPVLAGVIVIPALPLFAQDSTTQTNRLPEIVVTATRTEEPVAKTAASVTVLTQADFTRQNLTTLADALETVPGLAVLHNGTPGQVTSVFSRGAKNSHTQLVVDGRRVPAMLAGGYDWSTLDLAGVERIEVLRSANSALYGGDAIGGVVNVRTFSGRGLAKPVHEVSSEAGSFNMFRETIASRGAVANMFDYAVSASRFDAAFPRDNNDQRITSLRSSFGYEFAPTLYADFKAAYAQADGGSPGDTSSLSLADHLKRESTQISPSLTWVPSDDVESQLYYSFDNQFQPSLTFGSTERINVLSHVVDWQATVRATDNWKLTFGAFWQEQAIQTTTTSFGVANINSHAGTLAGFGQSQWEVLPGLHVINAVRYDTYSDFANALTWRQGLAWAVPGARTTIFGNVSRSVATPTAQDLYYFYDDGSFRSAGNANLRPERALTFELGARQPLANDAVTMGLTLFRTQLRDAIEFVIRPYADPLPSRGENLGRALQEGAEASLAWRPHDDVDLAANYTYLTAHDANTVARLLRRPRHTANFTATWRATTTLTLNGGAHLVAGRVDTFGSSGTRAHGQDYCVFRAGASYAVNKSFTLWVRGENLTDVAYESAAGYPALRLGIYGGVKFTF